MTPLDLDQVQSTLRTKLIGRSIIHEMTCGSTMDIARSEARDGAAHGTVVIAEEQTSGRGRFGRSWTSPAGDNLYLTLITRPRREQLRSLSMIASLAVCLAIEDACGVTSEIKWPNDVLVGGRKLSGILVESEVSGNDVSFALVGIGINVNLDVDAAKEIRGIATSLMREVGHQVSRESVLLALLDHFERLYQRRQSEIVHHWRSRLETLGRRVTVTAGDQSYEGLAVDVNERGSLVLRRADGSVLTFEAAEVSLRDPARP